MILKSVVLRCGAERAFELFTEHAGEWWPTAAIPMIRAA
jgi:hypothetical protein